MDPRFRVAFVLLIGCGASIAPLETAARHPDRYAHQPPAPSGAVGLGIKPWAQDVDPRVATEPWTPTRPLRASAARGEAEPSTFVVYARRRLAYLDVRVSDLKSTDATISAAAVCVREVVRSPTRSHYAGSDTVIAGRLVPSFRRAPLPAGHFKEIWLDIATPSDAEPGVYTAQVTIDAGGHEVVRGLQLRVRDLRLEAPRNKGLGIYYRLFGKLDRPQTVRRDLADMREHGVENLVTDLRPTFRSTSGQIAIDMGPVSRGLDLLVDAGVRGTVVVDSGLVQLARALGHPIPYVDPRGGASVNGKGRPAFREQAVATMRAIRDQIVRHPQLDVAVSHLDEVFRPERRELFVSLASAAPDVGGVPIYATLSTWSPQEDRWRRQIDPFVDIRAHHGFTFEWWIARGNDWDDYALELERSGDQAWFYHNDRGTWFTARWARIVNGVLLWFGPFRVHAPWTFQSFDERGVEDADTMNLDFAVAYPDPDDPAVLIPTRNWLAVREGYDDLRYLEALRRALAEHGTQAPEVAADARGFLRALRSDVRRAPTGLDAEALPSTVGSAAEAPLLGALARRYDTGYLDLLRDRIEELVVSLRTAGAGLPSR